MNHEQQMVPQHLTIDTMQRYAKAFVLSGLFSTQDTNKGLAQAFVKIQAGQELGLAPFAAMRGLNVMNGKVELSAGLMAAIVRRSGTVRFRVTESTETSCTLTWAEREGDEWVEVGTSTFTIEEATRAGLVKSGSPWTTYPSDMLWNRALSRGFRRYAADLSAGAPVYVEGEVSGEPGPEPSPIEEVDVETGEIIDIEPAERAADAPDEDAPTQEGEVIHPPSDPSATLATRVQVAMIVKLCGEAGVEEATVCERYGCPDIDCLSAEDAAKAIAALTATIEQKGRA